MMHFCDCNDLRIISQMPIRSLQPDKYFYFGLLECLAQSMLIISQVRHFETNLKIGYAIGHDRGGCA